jgi:universal stress protein A
MKPNAISKGDPIAGPEYGSSKRSASKTERGGSNTSESGLKEVGTELKSAFRMEVILAPTDLSVESRQVLHHAIHLAEDFGAQLTLVHFYDEREPQRRATGSCGYEWMLKEEQASQNKLFALRDEIRTVYRNCSSLFYIGNPIKEIPKVAKELRADLIVISTHHPRGAFSYMFGSDAEKILGHAPCPVLIFRQEPAQPDLGCRESKPDDVGFGFGLP